ATAAYAHGVLVRDESGSGAVGAVVLLESAGTEHVIWHGSDPAASGAPEDFVLRFPTTSYQVAAIRVFVASGGSIDAVRLLTSGTTSSLTVSSCGYDGSGNYALTDDTSAGTGVVAAAAVAARSEEHTSE